MISENSDIVRASIRPIDDHQFSSIQLHLPAGTCTLSSPGLMKVSPTCRYLGIADLLPTTHGLPLKCAATIPLH